MIIAGIDPGPRKSALTIIEDNKPIMNIWDDNKVIEDIVRWEEYDVLGYEWVACYGNAVGEDVLRTGHECGRLSAVMLPEAKLYEQTRPQIIHHLCGKRNLPKSATRAALIDRWGGKEATKKGNPLYKIYKHMWDSLAVCVYIMEEHYGKPETYWRTT